MHVLLVIVRVCEPTAHCTVSVAGAGAELCRPGDDSQYTGPGRRRPAHVDRVQSGQAPASYLLEPSG